LFVETPFKVAGCIDNLVDDDDECFLWFGIGRDRIVWNGEREVIVVANAVVGVGP
jgi:hypothetical protein